MNAYPDYDDEPAGSNESKSGSWLVRGLVALVIMLGLPLAVYFVAMSFTEKGYSPLGLMGAPVFTKIAEGERTYLLTGQWRLIRPPGRYTSGYDYTEFYVDLWAVDSVTAQTVWRKRLETERGGGMIDRDLLGVDGNVVWLLLHGKLVALSAADGSVLAPVGRVEEANPELKGLMPVDARYFAFDHRGLCITAADARQWRVDPETFKVTAVETVPKPAKEGAFPPEFISPGISGLHLVRGLDMTDAWLGLLTDAEAKSFEESDRAPDLTQETRRRLWRARVMDAKGEMGKLRDYSDLKLLPEAPEFLDGGLLREYSKAHQLPALWATDPASVFVLHRERLGKAGKLRLARVSGPDGDVVWEAPLPLTVVQSVKRMENIILLFGIEYIEGDPDISDALRDSPARLVSIELATGTLHVFSFSALDTLPEASEVVVGL